MKILNLFVILNVIFGCSDGSNFAGSSRSEKGKTSQVGRSPAPSNAGPVIPPKAKDGTDGKNEPPAQAQMDEDAKKIAATLDNLRWNLPCKNDPGSRRTCPTQRNVSDVKTLSGDTKTLYKIKARFRGIVEPKPYKDGDNGTSPWSIGGRPSGNAWNIYALEISDPPKTYYLNRAESIASSLMEIDYTETFEAYGGAKITISADTKDGLQISNYQGLTVKDLENNPYNGQFIHLKVISINATK